LGTNRKFMYLVISLPYN